MTTPKAVGAAPMRPKPINEERANGEALTKAVQGSRLDEKEAVVTIGGKKYVAVLKEVFPVESARFSEPGIKGERHVTGYEKGMPSRSITFATVHADGRVEYHRPEHSDNPLVMKAVAAAKLAGPFPPRDKDSFRPPEIGPWY